MSLSSEIAGAIEEPDDLSVSQSSSASRPNSGSDSSSNGNSHGSITLTERMISACSGSIATSLLVTPLDVVRVRLQQQELLYPDSSCCQRQVFWELPATLPNQVATTACRTAEVQCITTNKYTGTWDALFRIAKSEGPVTLWRGLSLTLLMAAPANIVYFTGYEVLRDNSPIRNSTIINPLLSGAIARVLAGTVVAPIELLKTRLQSIPSSQGNVLQNLISTARSELSSKGPSSLFKGLALTLWRDVPFSAIYWASYEFFKESLSRNLKVLQKHDEYNLFLNSFISGSLSGTLAALFTNPFDVGKTRLQISNEKGTSKEKKSMFKFLGDIIKFEGFGALYVGILPRVLKIAPSCAIMISSYELGKRYFAIERSKS